MSLIFTWSHLLQPGSQLAFSFPPKQRHSKGPLSTLWRQTCFSFPEDQLFLKESRRHSFIIIPTLVLKLTNQTFTITLCLRPRVSWESQLCDGFSGLRRKQVEDKGVSQQTKGISQRFTSVCTACVCVYMYACVYTQRSFLSAALWALNKGSLTHTNNSKPSKTLVPY